MLTGFVLVRREVSEMYQRLEDSIFIRTFAIGSWMLAIPR